MKKLAAALFLTAALVACGSKAKNTNTMPANSGPSTPADGAGSNAGSAAGGGSAMTMPMNGSGSGATGSADPCAPPN